jgi:hypothetical protein
MPLADDILAVLNDPTHMWSRALGELSQESRRLFLMLTLLPHPILMDDLQIAYSAQKFNKTGTFSDSLRTLDDTFISISAGIRISISAATQNRRWIDFWNPSLQDFSQEYLNQHSDLLDSLLDAPTYYEQVTTVYDLAMVRHPDRWSLPSRSAGPPYTKIIHKESAKYAGIRSWVTRRHSDLLAKAIELAASNSILSPDVYFRRTPRWKILKELIEIMLEFGDSLDRSEEQSFNGLIEQALESASKPSAADILELIQGNETGKLIERHYSGNALEVLRSSILDEDEWKFPLLAKIDEMLGIDPNVSMLEWGDDYVRYVNLIVDGLSNSTDWERLDKTIRELEDTASFLGLDLYDSISALETRRDNLPPERDEDYEGYGSDSGSSDSRADDLSSERQLNNIFGSLLE